MAGGDRSLLPAGCPHIPFPHSVQCRQPSSFNHNNQSNPSHIVPCKMQLGLSEGLSSLVARRFVAAKDAGHLIFSSTHRATVYASGLPVNKLPFSASHSPDFSALTVSLPCPSINFVTAQLLPRSLQALPKQTKVPADRNPIPSKTRLPTF